MWSPWAHVLSNLLMDALGFGPGACRSIFGACLLLHAHVVVHLDGVGTCAHTQAHVF